MHFITQLQTEHATLYNWVLFPLTIFCGRLIDVSLATLRSVLASKGHKNIVPVIAFFEVLLWLIVISQILKNLNNVMSYIAFAGGYSAGTYLGLLLEEKLALGKQVIRIITNKSDELLLEAFRTHNIGFTEIDAQGSRGPVKLIFTIVERKETAKIIGMITLFSPDSFYSIEDVKRATDVSYGTIKKQNKNLLDIVTKWR
ncbi:MAG: DUF2179 domain-containing protein [Bacteroidia bacterium]|nr:DUF2179 domain-containing protein [Bacteroidia bacterium]